MFDFSIQSLIIVTNEENKKRLLNELASKKMIRDYSFYSINELKNELFFSYDKRALFAITEKFGKGISEAQMILENLFFLDDMVKDEKVQKLVEIRDYLDKEGLLFHSTILKEKMKKTNVLFYALDELEEVKRLISEVEKYTKVNISNQEESRRFLPEVREFETLDNEVSYVFQRICLLLKSGVSIDNIKLMNAGSDYYFALNKYQACFHVGVSIPERIKVTTSRMIKDYLLEAQKIGARSAFKEFQENLSFDERKILVNILNEYFFIEDEFKIYPYLLYELNNSHFALTKLEGAIELVTTLYIPKDTDYVFFLGFNQNNIYEIRKDDDYLLDSIKESLGIDTSKSLNKVNKKRVKTLIYNTKNLTITSKRRSNFENFIPATLVKEMGLRVIKDDTPLEINLSELNAKLESAKALEDYYRYNVETPLLRKANAILKNGFHSYNPNFKVKESLVIPKMPLSFSAIDSYANCAFSFFLSYIIKQNDTEENINLKIGSYMHYVLQRSYEDNFDFDEVVNEYFQINDFKIKDKFFLLNTNRYLKAVIEFNKRFESISRLNEVFLEKKVKISLSDNYILKGTIDKLRYYIKEDTAYLALFDYKSGEKDINYSFLEYGLNMQLPIYLYFLLESGLFDMNKEIIGFYFQQILPKAYQIEIDESVFQLKGYTSAKSSNIEAIDPQIEGRSNYIKGLNILKSGSLDSRSKVLTERDILDIRDLVSNYLEKLIKELKTGFFPINPKYYKTSVDSCRFCSYRDICFKTSKNYVYLKKKED